MNTNNSDETVNAFIVIYISVIFCRSLLVTIEDCNFVFFRLYGSYKKKWWNSRLLSRLKDLKQRLNLMVREARCYKEYVTLLHRGLRVTLLHRFLRVTLLHRVLGVIILCRVWVWFFSFGDKSKWFDKK